AGENATGTLDFVKMVEAGAVDYVQPSAVKNGITAQWEICTRAEASGVTCVPHAPYFGPGYLATLQILAAKPKSVALERFFCDLALMPFARTVPIVDGWVDIPQGAGLGADPEDDLMRFRA